ncbi:hypothetical protein RWV98_12905 [Agathobaculum sp. NTUH-O15-33]|uniref:hypothetical protein n=1 Tax=Agathobaculum sp. NTUH-O15-33 TaxID=3079302 RepID=UPI0029586E3D|nr:hypothetical protein [Agathobaculum sp. NTUH-O15-33]WNX83501.1 hypothetical protein RWV98_12905 [Agathobaculum sp. NTUH-O15-33]
MNKKIIYAISTVALIASSLTLANAAEPIQTPALENLTTVNEIILRADVIVYKTRIHEGRQQYRRWNETRGYWVDPEWIDL